MQHEGTSDACLVTTVC